MNFILKTTDLILSASKDKIYFIVIDMGNASYSFQIVIWILSNNPNYAKAAHSPLTHTFLSVHLSKEPVHRNCD